MFIEEMIFIWYYVKIGGSVFSSKDYLIMEQFVKELSGNYSIQETTEDLSKYEIDEQSFI